MRLTTPSADLKDQLSTSQPVIEGEDTRAIVWLDIDKCVLRWQNPPSGYEASGGDAQASLRMTRP